MTEQLFTRGRTLGAIHDNASARYRDLAETVIYTYLRHLTYAVQSDCTAVPRFSQMTYFGWPDIVFYHVYCHGYRKYTSCEHE